MSKRRGRQPLAERHSRSGCRKERQACYHCVVRSHAVPYFGGALVSGTHAMSLKYVLICLAAALTIVVALTGGWIWWTRPALRSVSPPPGGEERVKVRLGEGLMPQRTTAGTISPGGLSSERHKWVGTLVWTNSDKSTSSYKLTLGESVHIDQLGEITLIAVEPVPLDQVFHRRPGGGYRVTLSIDLESTVQLCNTSDCATPE